MSDATTKETDSKPERQKRYTVKKMIPFLLFTVAIIYGLVPALVLAGFFNRVVLAPYKLEDGKITILSNGIKAEQLYFTNADGDKLCGWYFKNPGARKIILFSHGNAGNISHRISFANAFTKCGASVFLFDYRGYGLSTGKPTVDGILNDGLAAYDYVKEQLGYDPRNIIVAGESIGSLVACTVASSQPCDGLMLQAPLRSLASVAKFHFPCSRIYPDFLLPGGPLANTDLIKKIHVPVLLIHGQKDKVVPFDNSEDLLSCANEPKKLVSLPDCGHNDIGYYDADIYLDAIGNFISRHE